MQRPELVPHGLFISDSRRSTRISLRSRYQPLHVNHLVSKRFFKLFVEQNLALNLFQLSATSGRIIGIDHRVSYWIHLRRIHEFQRLCTRECISAAGHLPEWNMVAFRWKRPENWGELVRLTITFSLIFMLQLKYNWDECNEITKWYEMECMSNSSVT